MPRANRYFLPGYIWHITHRCHKKDFLLKFSRDRQRWIHWLFEAKKRYGLCVLNYVVTSNHIHLLVKDTGVSVIPKSIQLIAGRTAQEFNNRKGRKGAFWEDRYHATAVDSDKYLSRCLVYIDLNMVRAGVVLHPGEWQHGGYMEIQQPPRRYRIINIPELMKLFAFTTIEELQTQHQTWVAQELMHESSIRDERWSESIAVGRQLFIDQVRKALGMKALYKTVVDHKDGQLIKEDYYPYNPYFDRQMDNLKTENTFIWDVI